MTTLPFTLETTLTAALFIGLRISGLVLFAPGFSNNAVRHESKPRS